MREKEIEMQLVSATKKCGGLCWKFISPGNSGVPDRIVLMPDGKMAFVELKAPGKTMRPLQVRRKTQLQRLVFMVYCLDSLEDIPKILRTIGGDKTEIT